MPDPLIQEQTQPELRSAVPRAVGQPVHDRCIVMVADGARADLMKQMLDSGRLPNIQRHIVDRGCYRTALTVFPSTTGPAHIPFVAGVHPGTANVPGYRWLCRRTHDQRRRSIYRHRSLNSPRGLMVGRDMDPERVTSLYQYFRKPSSVLELVDYCPNRHLYRLIARRLIRIVRAHKTDDWAPVDDMVERLIKRRIRAGSECIIGSFFGIDEYSHLYSPSHEKTIAAYENIDCAIGRIATVLEQEGLYDQTLLTVISDHGLTATHTHIPVVDIVKAHGFNPYYYPKLYRRAHDSAVMESGNAMAQLYFKRGDRWGEAWRHDEVLADAKTCALLQTLLDTEGMSFACTRSGDDGIVVQGRHGWLEATRRDGGYQVQVKGDSPLPDHPTGFLTSAELFRDTYDHTYPDAVNQLFMLFASPRSGDVILSSEPGFDLRLQHEDPEHHGSHGSLHRDHMQVPLAFSVPFTEDKVYTYDIVPTILALTGKKPTHPFDGRILDFATFRGGPSRHTVPTPEVLAAQPDTSTPPEPASRSSKLTGPLLTLLFIISGLVLAWTFGDRIEAIGQQLMVDHGQTWLDVILLLTTAISSTPLMLPIAGYCFVGVLLGYNVIRLAVVMAVGSALGSYVSFAIGRYFGDHPWVRKRFPNLRSHKWAQGKSRKYVTLMLFLGTASPLPCDVFYVACGAIRYPRLLFLGTMMAARTVRYLYLGYGFKYLQGLV